MSGAYASYFNLSEEALLSLVTQMETFAVCAGSLSFIASSMVVMTVYLFPSMWHNKIYMQMIVMTSVCDLLASFAVILGYPSGSLCTFQGTLIMFCFRGAWFWSVLMLLQLNHIVQYSKVLLSFRMMNILVWLTNLLLELLPLTTGDWYTNAKQFQGKIVCTLDFYDNNFYVWICTVSLLHPSSLPPLLALYPFRCIPR